MAYPNATTICLKAPYKIFSMHRFFIAKDGYTGLKSLMTVQADISLPHTVRSNRRSGPGSKDLLPPQAECGLLICLHIYYRVNNHSTTGEATPWRLEATLKPSGTSLILVICEFDLISNVHMNSGEKLGRSRD
jgi:hypothetical protein